MNQVKLTDTTKKLMGIPVKANMELASFLNDVYKSLVTIQKGMDGDVMTATSRLLSDYVYSKSGDPVDDEIRLPVKDAYAKVFNAFNALDEAYLELMDEVNIAAKKTNG